MEVLPRMHNNNNNNSMQLPVRNTSGYSLAACARVEYFRNCFLRFLTCEWQLCKLPFRFHSREQSQIRLGATLVRVI